MVGYPLLTMFAFYTKAGVAQLAEHQPSKLRVAGSIPVSRSIVSTLRLPGLILRLPSGQAARACSGLTPSTSLRASSERRFFTPSSKAGLGAAEWVKIILLINFPIYLASLSF